LQRSLPKVGHGGDSRVFFGGRPMFIRCWGSRGSIPVSGPEYIRYGGDTTCLEIRTENGHVIIVDAGTGIRKLGNSLLREGLYSYDLLFTHAHWDHLMGFPFFKPLYREEVEIRIQGCPFAQKFVKTMLGKVMSPPNFPLRYQDVKAVIQHEPACLDHFEVDGVTIVPIMLSHPNQGNGYKFTEAGRSFVFLTDNELGFQHRGGLPFETYQEFCRGAELLIHDAEFTEEEYKETVQWGHSTYESALRLACQAGVKRLGLFHLNQDRTDDEVDRIVDRCRHEAPEGEARPECFAVGVGMSFII